MTDLGAWAQFPPPAPPAPIPVLARSTTARAASTFVLLLAGPAIVASGAVQDSWFLLLLIAGSTATAMSQVVSRSERTDEPAVVALGGALLCGWLVDPLAGIALLATGLVAVWACLDRHPPALPRIDPDVAPTIVGAAGAMAVLSIVGLGLHPALQILVPVAALITGALRPAWTRRLGDALARGAVVVGTIFVRVLIGLVGLIVVCLPWAIQRLTRWDPTWVPRRSGTRWVARTGAAARDDRLWGPDPRVLRTTPGRRLHRVAVIGVVAVLVVTWMVLVVARIEDQTFRDKYDHAAALEDAPWAIDLQRSVDDAFARADLTSYYGVAMPDTRSELLNIRDGARATWQPPTSDCTPIRIWMFGGSAMFGLGQRDDATIASWLARLAWDEGIPLAIENRGVPADVHWIEGRRIEDAILSGTTAPDRVIFYDGTNDLDVQSYLNGLGLGGARLLASYPDGKDLRDLQHDNERNARLWEFVRGGPTITKDSYPLLGTEDLAAWAAKGYAASGELASSFLEEHDIAETWFYQPSRASRSTPVAEEQGAEAYDPSRATLERAFRSKLPDQVIDLSGAMDGEQRPIYYDWVHTNEEGARIVAAAMLEHLRPQLEADLAERGETSCR